MGVYPLIEDERCWFLAVDFDKSCWQDDVMAFVETCRTVAVPVARAGTAPLQGSNVTARRAAIMKALMAYRR
jgi:hypothetical protein